MMYRLEERDFLLSRFREMQRFSLFSQPSLSLVEQSRFFRFTRTCDATREFIPSKTTKAGEESREVLSSSLGPNRGSPLYRKPKRLLREARRPVRSIKPRDCGQPSPLTPSFPFCFLENGEFARNEREKEIS